ncbi:MAG: toll/interleukin-1 receptor domain-containing protein [Blastocatellia bacterium]|nr:toll/interleukin-1 receptor domain-containing protein [Blastocatellia bacterium]
MADKKHLEILMQGVEAWNKWRRENFRIRPDLRKADLSGEDLRNANLSDANLRGSNLSEANLSYADLSLAKLSGAKLSSAKLSSAHFNEAHLRKADLSYANLSYANLFSANLSYANLRGAHLDDADLSYARLIGADLRAILANANFIGADLSRANLSGADLIGVKFIGADLSRALLSYADFNRANLSGALLSGTDFNEAAIFYTVFADNDLSQVKGLETVKHIGPSHISIDTIYKSRGEIPEAFLRGCGVPDNFITYMRSLTGKAFEFYSCFISYSSKNHDFAERLYADLQNKGVRCWFAPEDLKIGEKIRVGIDESIRMHDKLLLVLSKHSVESEWVEQEVETALSKEREQKRLVLFPIRLDDSVMKINAGWPALIKNSRNIGDFKKWKDHDAYRQAFERLIRDLKAEGSTDEDV